LDGLSGVVEKVDVAVDTAWSRGVGVMLNDEGGG